MKQTLLLIDRDAYACLVGHNGTVTTYDISRSISIDRLDQLINELFIQPESMQLYSDAETATIQHYALTLPLFGARRPGGHSGSTVETIHERIHFRTYELGELTVRAAYSDHNQCWYVAEA